MEPEFSIISPKPNKSFIKSSYTFRKNYLSKLNIEMINEKEHPNSTKNTSKNQVLDSKNKKINNLNNVVKDDITSSTTPYDSFHQGLENTHNKQNKINFFDDINFFEKELTQQEGEEEILSIISDFNDRGSRRESLKNSHTPVSCHQAIFLKTTENLKETLVVSLGPPYLQADRKTLSLKILTTKINS